MSVQTAQEDTSHRSFRYANIVILVFRSTRCGGGGIFVLSSSDDILQDNAGISMLWKSRRCLGYMGVSWVT